MSTKRIEVPGMGIVEFPADMSDDQIAAAIKRNMAGKPETGYTARNLRNFVLTSPPGAVARGVMDIVDTGLEFAARLGGPEEVARVRAMNKAGKDKFEAAQESLVAPPRLLSSVARIGGNVLATAPAVTALGGAVAPLLPRLGQAIRTGGMSTGAAPVGAVARAGDMGLRMGGGAIGGGLAAGMVNPDDAGTGAAIGAALPPVLMGLGTAGRAVGQAFQPREVKAARRLQEALGDDAAVAALARPQTLVPGSEPTVAQVLRTPRASTLERIVSETPGGEVLRDRYAAQSAARMAALEGIAPVDARGFRSAQEDLGEAVSRYYGAERKAAKSATGRAYQAVPQDEAAFYLPELAPIRDEFFGPGVVGGRQGVDAIVSEAQRIGQVAAPAVNMAPKAALPPTLGQAVRRMGGLSMERNGGRAGELKALGQSLKGIVRRTGGMDPDTAAMAAFERGYIGNPTIDDLLDALQNEARGNPAFSMADDMAAVWQRQLMEQADRAGEFAGAGAAAPKKVTLREFDNLRKSIGNLQREAAREPGRATEARALAEMKKSMDDRINEVVRGDGAVDEVLPIAWADALDEARRLKLKEVERFLTGPQADMARLGRDGQPLLKGGEVAAKFWGNRPGIADDVKSFRRLVDDNPKLLGQFRELITTEGASTQTAGGNLSNKFVKWVDQRLPGLQQAFEPDQVRTLRRLAADIKRGDVANAAGAARGSPTYMNAANATKLGLLDSNVIDVLANRLPFGGLGLSALRGYGQGRVSEDLAALLVNPQAAADALARMQQSQSGVLGVLGDPFLSQLAVRGAPVLAADR
jgi:hypothetical protein